MPEKINQLYDKIFKKILTLSSVAVTNLINGLFGTDYPPDSRITYNWTEFHDGNLKRILADTIVTINGCHSYHMEAQMERDEDIVFRVLEYGFGHACQNKDKTDERYVLHFPEPKVIYLYYEGSIPDTYELSLDFGSQGTFLYHVPVFKFPDISIKEINDRKLIILIPFQLLKLRRLMEKERSPENLTMLTNLIQNDIISSIETNLQAGNITAADARMLNSYTLKLYRHIYAHYEELEVLTEMTDESFMTDVDLFYKQIDELNEKIAEKKKAIEEMDKTIAEKDNALTEKDSALAEKDSALAEKDSALAEKDNTIAEKDAEIKRLRELLAAKA